MRLPGLGRSLPVSSEPGEGPGLALATTQTPWLAVRPCGGENGKASVECDLAGPGGCTNAFPSAFAAPLPGSWPADGPACPLSTAPVWESQQQRWCQAALRPPGTPGAGMGRQVGRPLQHLCPSSPCLPTSAARGSCQGRPREPQVLAGLPANPVGDPE